MEAHNEYRQHHILFVHRHLGHHLRLGKMADWQAKHRADKNKKHDSNHSGA
ncbi:hypothetical protein Acaty_m0002 (plasmid) [Acidithiobacillus caldus ATCC 51756]|uniref:Uncharacterized protein n=1 Tax=Acidithiobacillus caldus (strain ATCC 51756 / DSM 8584 / KU) TaxID=637389 RepID=A0A059ZYH1_ACICK|nr:hypothetical protein Acaty_m0002 [Acidithiobacillus caldus ATCC 51756]